MVMIRPEVPEFEQAGGARGDPGDDASSALSSAEMDAIDAMHARLSEGPYALLGLARDATRPDIRAAYFQRMTRFHPEVFWGRELSLYRPRVEAIHGALTTAFEVLCDSRRRAEYDASLDAPRRASSPKYEAVRAPLKVTGVTARATAEPSPPRRHFGAATQPVESRAPASLEREEAPVPRDVTQQSLARSRAEHIIRQRIERAAELDAKARDAQVRGDEVAMASLLRQALALMPEHEDIKRRLEDYEARRTAAAHDRFSIAARTHERDKRWDAAFGAWMKAIHERPTSLSAHLGAVSAACEGLIDLPSAAELARKATQLDPKSAAAQASLARVFFLAGRMASARGAVEAALRLDGRHEGALELARRLKLR